MTIRVRDAGPGHRQTRRPAKHGCATRPAAALRGIVCRSVVCSLEQRRETNADGGRKSRRYNNAFTSSFRKRFIAGTDCGDRRAVIAAQAEPEYPGCVGVARACVTLAIRKLLVNPESQSAPGPLGRAGRAGILLVTGAAQVVRDRTSSLSIRPGWRYGSRDGPTSKSTPPPGDGPPGRRFRGSDGPRKRGRLPGQCLRPCRRRAGPNVPRADQARLRGNNSGDAG
jgi:hypothetical protein